MKQVKLKQIKDSNTALMKELEEQQLLAEIRIAETQFAAGLGLDNATARSVLLERLAKRAEQSHIPNTSNCVVSDQK